MTNSCSHKERLVSLCIAMLYVWLGIYSTKNPWVGFYALAYSMFPCVLIWYPDQVSRIQITKRFSTHLRIPPIYFRYLGWVMLLGPVAVAFAGSLVVSITGRRV